MLTFEIRHGIVFLDDEREGKQVHAKTGNKGISEEVGASMGGSLKGQAT